MHVYQLLSGTVFDTWLVWFFCGLEGWGKAFISREKIGQLIYLTPGGQVLWPSLTLQEGTLCVELVFFSNCHLNKAWFLITPVGASSLHLYCGQRFPDNPLLLPQRNVLTIVPNSEHRTMNIFQRGRNLGDFFSFHRLLSGHFRKWSVPRLQELKQGSGCFSRNR